MSIYWWLHRKLTRRARAERWAAGIRVRSDDTGASWEVEPRAEFAESRMVRWDEVAGVAEWPDDGAAPDSLYVLCRGAITADLLPLEADGTRALLEAARRRGLVRFRDELVAEREANERALSSGVTIRIATPDEYERVRAAYLAWGYDGGVSPTDVVYVAERDTELVGVVRRTREHDVIMLRGMLVAPAWRGRRIGSRLLRAFIADLPSEECYCLPYTRLVTFYGAVGFGVMREEVAPPFLRERLADYRRRGLKVVLMHRPRNARMYG
jgi:GNAT superfamily N-acetyltransferase